MTELKNEDYIEKFGAGASDKEVSEFLGNLAKLFALSLEDLYIKWEQFSIHRNEQNTDLSQQNLDEFKQYLQHQVEKKAAQISASSSNPASVTKKPNVKRLGESPSLFGFNIPKTPTLKKMKLNNVRNSASGSSLKKETGSKLQFNAAVSDASGKENSYVESNNATSSPELSTIKTPTPLKKSEESGKVLDSFNPENIDASNGLDPEFQGKLKITPFYDPEKYKFRTMRQNLLDASEVLDEQIDIFTKLVRQHYELAASDFGDPTIQSQSEIYAVGRVVPDSPSSEGFLNVESLVLETSRVAGIGRRIRLNLSKINEVSLFCGQIIAVRGKNADGSYFMVDQILELPYPDSPVSTSEEIQAAQLALDNSAMKVVVTSGPYFADDNFDISHLLNFVTRINEEIKPHILIMFGPFIDITSSMVATGKLPTIEGISNQPKTLDELFTKVMAPILKGINNKTQVIVIPSTRDVLSKHGAYPQSSLDRKSLDLPKNFKCFTNPATFQLNEIFFGCSNVDIYKDMKEITKGGNTSMRNRIDRISEHVLQQRRYYPIFPGGIRKKVIGTDKTGNKIFEHISGADLEVPYLGLTEFVGNFTPDVVIIPSELQHFARVVKNVVMINPGRFVRPKGNRGTYAEITITAPDLESGILTKMEGDEAIYLHNAWKRTRVDLVTV